MNQTKYVLRCIKGVSVRGGSIDFDLHVLTLRAQPVEHYELMCEAIYQDVLGTAGAVLVMDWVRKVESGEMALADVDGNAWIINITRDKVWFEGLYSQGEGGEVSLPQFKLALQTYCQFLSDPTRKVIEVEFPE